jgi:hypothetical protein
MKDRGEKRSEKFERFDEVRLPRPPLEKIRFSSASERACAFILSKYCDWAPYLGATYQIPVGRCLFDFRIGSTLIEWHPINLRNEFITPLFRQISALTDRLQKHKKADFINALESEMAAQYIRRRAQIVSAHPLFSSFDLLVCFTPAQFVDLVVSRSKDKPDFDDVLRDFNAVMRRR